MNTNNYCNLIEDLLPLYVEGLVSDKTKKDIEEHLKECNKCSELLKTIQKDNTLFSNEKQSSEETNNKEKEIKCIKNIKRKIILKTILAILVTIIITLVCMNILNTYRLIQDEDGKIILYNFNTGNIKKGLDGTNIFAEYVIKNNEKDIKYNILFTFNKEGICINTRTVIGGYSDEELKKEYDDYTTIWKHSVSNIKIENKKLYMNENKYIGKNKEDIIESLEKSYNAKIFEI